MKNEQNEQNKQKKNDIPENLNVAPSVKPFTKYRAIELAVCGIAVVCGLLYLYADIFTLAILLPLYSAFFCAIAILRYFDTKEQGGRGFAAMLPVACWAFLAVAVIAATVAYFVQG